MLIVLTEKFANLCWVSSLETHLFAFLDTVFQSSSQSFTLLSALLDFDKMGFPQVYPWIFSQHYLPYFPRCNSLVPQF